MPIVYALLLEAITSFLAESQKTLTFIPREVWRILHVSYLQKVKPRYSLQEVSFIVFAVHSKTTVSLKSLARVSRTGLSQSLAELLFQSRCVPRMEFPGRLSPQQLRVRRSDS